MVLLVILEEKLLFIILKLIYSYIYVKHLRT